MSWHVIRPQLSTLIGNLSEIQEVSSTPELNFNGYPAVHVVPSELESNYETNIENERIYAFLVRVFYETKNTGVGQAIDNLEEAVDAIIDALDNEDKLTSGKTIGVGLPSNYFLIGIEATPGLWGELVGDQLVFAELRVRIKISYDAS